MNIFCQRRSGHVLISSYVYPQPLIILVTQLTQGKIGAGSYVPSGLSAAEYEKIRSQEAAKKKANYDRNVKKAGVFEDFTAWYAQRGTDTNQKWAKSATRGHRMAKTKYDFDDVGADAKKYDGGFFKF